LTNCNITTSSLRGEVSRNLPAFQTFRRLIKTGQTHLKSDKTPSDPKNKKSDVSTPKAPEPDGGRSLTEARLRHEGHKDPASSPNPYDHTEAHAEYLPGDPAQQGGLGDVRHVHPDYVLKKMKAPVTVEDFAKPDHEKNWFSYGFDYLNKEEDRWLMHYSCFIMITCMFGFTGFLAWYKPDLTMHDWALREAYLEMHRRKKMGTEYVSRYYVDPSKITLPTEEELEGFEIII
jgi:hypothetical protein